MDQADCCSNSRKTVEIALLAIFDAMREVVLYSFVAISVVPAAYLPRFRRSLPDAAAVAADTHLHCC